MIEGYKMHGIGKVEWRTYFPFAYKTSIRDVPDEIT